MVICGLVVIGGVHHIRPTFSFFCISHFLENKQNNNNEKKDPRKKKNMRKLNERTNKRAKNAINVMKI